MKRKLAEWAIFAVVAVAAVLFVRWFIPRALIHYYRATGKLAPMRVEPALRQRLRTAENALADKPASSAQTTSSDAMPCLVVPAQTGVGTLQNARPMSPVRDCAQLVPGGRPVNDVEVNLPTGNLLFVQTDLYLPGNPPIAFTQVIEHLGKWNRRFQIFLLNEYDTYPFGDRFPYTYQELQLADRRQFLFQRVSKGGGYANAVYEHEGRGSFFSRALEGWNGDGWDVDLADGRTLVFPEAYHARRPLQGAIVGLIEPSGASLTLQRDRDGNLESVRSTDGRWMRLRHQGPLIVALEDSAGEKVSFSYEKGDLLASSTNTKGETLSYSYNEDGRPVEARNAGTGKIVFKAHYSGLGSITSLHVAGSGTFSFSYRVDPTGSYPEIDISEKGVGRWSVLLHNCTANGCAYKVRTR